MPAISALTWRYLKGSKFVSLRGQFNISHPQAEKCLLENYLTKIEHFHWVVKLELCANFRVTLAVTNECLTVESSANQIQ